MSSINHYPSTIKRYGKYLLAHPLFAGSAVMIIGNNVINFGNYIYHLIMGRLLGPASYGELAAVLSVLGILGMLPFSLGLVIVKFVSSAKNDKEITKLVTWTERRSLLFGLLAGGALLLTSPAISRFLHIQDKLAVAIIGPIFLLWIVGQFNRAALQGLMRFGRIVAAQIVDVLAKIIIGVLLVFMGYSVVGALGGLVVGGALVVFLTHIFIKDYIGTKEESPNLLPMVKYAIPVILMSFATTSLFSTDLVLVKHFFSAHDAGIYASLSTLGKIIFFGAGPVGSVMFPIVARRQARGENYKRVFAFSAILTLSIATGVLFIYWVLPELAINLLYGSLYLEGASLLFWFGVFMLLFTLSSLFASYHLSLGQTSVVVLPVLAALAQGIGIWLFHGSLLTVIWVSIFASGLLLAGLLVYFGYASAKEAK